MIAYYYWLSIVKNTMLDCLFLLSSYSRPYCENLIRIYFNCLAIIVTCVASILFHRFLPFSTKKYERCWPYWKNIFFFKKLICCAWNDQWLNISCEDVKDKASTQSSAGESSIVICTTLWTTHNQEILCFQV